MRLGIIGSTKFVRPSAYREAEEIIDEALYNLLPDVVVSGGADGIDSMGARKARLRDIEVVEHLPKNRRWQPEGFKARNILIAEDCDQLLVIRCRQSKTYGSGWTADYAAGIGVTVRRHLL